MTRALAVAAAASMLFGCSPAASYLPDGGHVRYDCANGTTVQPVKVLDVNGNPVSGATVTATNRKSGKTITGMTGANGVTTAITEAIGAGDVDLRATEGTRTSNVGSALWTCGDCDCIADPAIASLTVQ